MAEEKPIEDAVEQWVDPVIEFYKKDVDRTLIRENLKLTVSQRIEKLETLLREAEAIRSAVQKVVSRK